MTGQNANNLSDAIRKLIVCDTQFGWTGETTLKLPELLDLQARGWLIEGDENCEFSLTDEGRAVVARALQQDAPAELAEQQGVDGYDKRADLIARLYMARDMERAGAWSYLFAEAADALAATGKQVGEQQGDAHVLVLREMRARLSDAGSPARTAALDAAIAALAARQPVRIYGCCAQPEGELHTAECPNMRHIAARQPGAQVPVVVEAVATIKLDRDGEFYVDWLTEGGIHDLSVGDVLLAANSAITNDEGYGEVYAAPPAQGIDLGQLRSQVLGLTRRVEPISGQRFSYVQLDDVLALIDQGDAAPGVGNG